MLVFYSRPAKTAGLTGGLVVRAHPSGGCFCFDGFCFGKRR